MPSRQFFADIQFGSDALLLSYGDGSPESSKTAEISSLYIRSDASDSSVSLYIKNSGTGNTGWVPVAVIPTGGSTEEIVFIGSTGNLSSDSDFVYDSSTNVLTVNTAEYATGSAASPSITFQGDTDSGIYQGGSDIVTICAGGDAVVDFDNISTNKGVILKQSGHQFLTTDPPALTTPTYSFTADPASGFGRFTNGSLFGWAAMVSNTNVMYAFTSFSQTFLYFTGDNVLFEVPSVQFQTTTQLSVGPDCTAASPSIIFNELQSDTGIFPVSTDQFGISGQGVHWLTFDGVNYNLLLLDESAISLQDSSSSENVVSIKAPASISSSYILELPSDAPSDGEVLKWNSSSSSFNWQPNSNTVGLQWTIPDPENRTYKLFQYLPINFTIETVYYELDSGTCSLDLRLETTSIGGWSSLAASSTEQSSSASSNNNASLGNTLDLVVSSVSSADMLSITIIGTEV